MPDLTAPNSPAIGYLLALAIGFIVGRTREPGTDEPPRPGIRDFLIVAIVGASSAHLAIVPLSVTAFVAVAAVLTVMRLEHSERAGITTELAALATFILAYMCITPMRPVAAALAIVLASVLARKDALRRLVREEISDEEYIDTLSFLGLIFIIYPLLPAGSFGPFGFFDPRRIWLFVILVSGVSYVGYFLTKFVGGERGAILTAMVGALTSTTAYTAGISRAVAEAPETAVSASRSAIIGNSILFPRMIVIVAAVSPALAIAGVPAFAAMAVAGFAAALVLCRAPAPEAGGVAPATFRNPFSLRPALQFGVVFTGVLFFTRAAHEYLGLGGQMAVSAISGLVDVDAISLTLASFVQAGTSPARDAVIGMTLAAGVNAIFKSAIAQSSRQPAFYLRLMVGFVLMFAAGAAVLVFIDPSALDALTTKLLSK
jgi:uncharacterized membrane protein (DUF4010 family)